MGLNEFIRLGNKESSTPRNQINHSESLVGTEGRWITPPYDKYRYVSYTYLCGEDKKTLLDEGILVRTLFEFDFNSPQDVERGLDKIRETATNGLSSQIAEKTLWLVSIPAKGAQVEYGEIDAVSISIEAHCEHVTLKNIAQFIEKARKAQIEEQIERCLQIIAW